MGAKDETIISCIIDYNDAASNKRRMQPYG